jgi:hypothetical protein
MIRDANAAYCLQAKGYRFQRAKLTDSDRERLQQSLLSLS